MEEIITRIQGFLILLIWSVWIVSVTAGFIYLLCIPEEDIKEEDKNFVKKLKVITIILVMAYAVTHLYVYLY